MRRHIWIVVFAATVAGCGSAKTPSSSTGFYFDNRNLITYEEIKAAKTPGWNAWDLIAQVRPSFLRSRGATSLIDTTPVRPVVYLDGVWYGKLESLKNVNVEEIREIEFISAGDATTRYGIDHLGGAILIRTR